jgi:ornithine carbamoyltransferase
MNNYSPSAAHPSIDSIPGVGRSFLAVSQLDAAGLATLVAFAREVRATKRDSELLANRNIVLMFEKPSLRTRVTFEVAVRQLGGWPIFLDLGESRLGERESIADVARNLSLWVDGVVARVFSHGSLETLANWASIPVVNALSDLEHPCQAVADILTLADQWPTFKGRQLVYVGDWNNVSRSLYHACRLSGLKFRVVCPAGYGPAPGENVDWSTDVRAVKGADAIYTDVWASMGQEDELKDRIAVFRPYQVNRELLARTGKPTLFMHCLPAHRGQEVTDEVIEAAYSLVFQQAANRLPVEKAILISLMEANDEESSKEGRAGLLRGSGHLHHRSMAQGKLRL